MLSFIYSQIIFYISVILVLFLPGYFLLLAVFGKSRAINSLERFVISFGLSLVSVDFILFLYSKINISINRLSVILGILLFVTICYGICKFRSGLAATATAGETELFSFSRNQFILILLLLFLTVFIKTAYLSGTIAPTATDLGHHMYWAKLISETGKLTDYEGMPDFIIGEHTIFALINILTGQSFFSGWPIVILNLINILGILTVFILVLRIFKNKTAAILTLLFLGVLFAISSPQSKFVSSGVIGNIFGNLLMPLAFYFYYRTFEFVSVIAIPPRREKQSFDNYEIAASSRQSGTPRNDRIFLSLGFFVTFGLFYTHHLTAFIFLFIFLLLIPLFLLVNYRNVEDILKKSVKTIFSPPVIITFMIGLVFFFFIFVPSYLNPQAIDTAVGSPVKSTRVGLNLVNLKQTAGEPRLALGLIGLLLLAISRQRRDFGYALIASWTVMIFIMSVAPNLLFIDLPSSRIGNYLSYPLAILGAFGFYHIFNPQFIFEKTGRVQNFSAPLLFKGAFILILAFAVTSGLSDSAQAFKQKNSAKELAQTLAVSQYVAENSQASDMVLKDHNYITGDTWMKLFFMRGYKYPLSRSYFRRYEDSVAKREDCTLVMISNPGSEQAKQCFSDTGTDFLIINPRYDSAQFLRLPNFDQVYMSNDVATYYRK